MALTEPVNPWETETPAEALAAALGAILAALDAAHAAGQTVPPQAAQAVAMLQIAAMQLGAEMSIELGKPAVTGLLPHRP